MEDPTFALQGISMVYNYGCEAIVRGTVAILRSQWPGCRILYTTRNRDFDTKALGDLDLEIVGSDHHIPFFSRAANKLLRVAGLQYRVKVRHFYDWLGEVDCVLSIGGDNFTLWPAEEQAKTFPRVEDTRFIMDSGKPLVLWGASVGPFESNPRALRTYAHRLRRLSMILAREKPTVQYLAKLGIERTVRQMGDPAFVMEADGSHAERDGAVFGERPVLGVNFSPLSAHFAAHEDSAASDLPQCQVEMIVDLVKCHDLDVVLIPHVVCPWKPGDDDYEYMKQIRDGVPTSLQSRVTLLPPGLGARRTKWVVSRCHALMSARMHCAIAGLSSGVPTLLLSYSRKAIGMCEYVYGNRDWVTPVSCDNERILGLVDELLRRAAELKDFLNKRREAIREDALNGAGHLKDILS